MMNYYFEVLKKYAVFSGRARRKEYWMFVLINTIVSLILTVIDTIVFGESSLFNGIYSLAVLLPAIGAGIRRMHDIGKSGWFLLIPIYNIVLACRVGNTGENKYGADPKQVKTV
jgi:uncharacterized membrane protein YhaH (DUF805 family)